MEAAVASVGKALVDCLLSKAKSTIAEDAASKQTSQRDLVFLTDELAAMQSFLGEIDEERKRNMVPRTRMEQQIRDLAYDVDNCLDDYIVHLEKPSRWRFARTVLERYRIAEEMKGLRARVEDMSPRNTRYRGLEHPNMKRESSAERSGTLGADAKWRLDLAAAIFGIDDARRAAKFMNQRVDLVQLINEEDEDLRVVAVWGTGGDIGQTSIIRAAYENPDVRSKFPGRAWVRVMHPFSPKDFVQSLVNQFHAAKGVEDLFETEKTAQELTQEFNGFVNEKRCLIVLNDISTIEEWDRIKNCFPNNKKGSRIIVSTTQVEVASLCAGQESQASELKQLCADQTLYAFYDKGARNGKNSVDPACSSDTATSSTDYHAVCLGEIAEDESKDTDGKRVVPKRTRIGTGKDSVKPSSSSDMSTCSTNDHAVILGEITEDESKDANGNKVVTKSLTRIGTGVVASEESQLIGREREIVELIDLISNEDRQKGQVICVWGMGGIGRTTLVNGIYYSPKLSDKFDKRVFVTIMRPFDPSEHLRRLIVGLHEGSSRKEELLVNSVRNKRKKLASMGVGDLTKEVAWLLETKRCLIILDDLSSTAEWDLLVPKLPQMKISRILVTTREANIARHCTGSGKHGTMHNLKVLEPEDARHLFNKKVFGTATNFVQQSPELIKEANQILKKCGGLPLAIVTIGGYLASRPKTRAEWRKLNENIGAKLDMNRELGMIRTVLQKSYDGLPDELKSCFLYLSIFPEDHIISRSRLVRLWTAEGYSSERRGMSANEMAENYFTELKNRSMILPSQRSVHSRKSMDSCKVHDLIRDISISKSMEENLVFRLEEGCGLSAHGAIRHLAISSNWKGDQSEFESIVDLSRIRSLSVFGNFRPFYISEKMRFLRVLDLEGMYDIQYHHLDHIWKLLHLKYLSLRGCSGIDLLPDSLGNLRQLEVLDVRDTLVKALPKTLIKLWKLQYIHAGRKSDGVTEEKVSLTRRCLQGACLCATCCLPILCDIDGPCHKAFTRRDACTFACCMKFPALVTGVYKERGAMVPRGARKLKDLHTLSEVNVGRGIAVLHDIRMLTGLRKLGVSGINKKNGPAFRSAISNLSSLESLTVSSAGKPGLRGCLDDISSPPEKLQSLKLYGNMEVLPEWIKELPHLVKLKLVGTRLLEHDAAMEFLGKLPKLEILVLSWSWSSFDGEELDFKSLHAGIAFERLRVLTIVEATNIVHSVKIERGTMTKLERLHFSGFVDNGFCFSGLEFLSSINEVQLHVFVPGTQRHELKKKIQEQLAGNANEPIVTVY